MLKIAWVVTMVMAAGCSGIVLGRAGPGRGAITLTNDVCKGSCPGGVPSPGSSIETVRLGETYNTYLLAGLMGPSKSTMTGATTSTGFGADLFAEFLYNTARFFGIGARVGVTEASGEKMSYFGVPIMLEGAIGAHLGGEPDSERSAIGSRTGLAISLHAGVGYVAEGKITRDKDSASVGGYRGNVGLRLTLPITIVQFTLTAEVAYMSSATTLVGGVDTSFQATSLLFGNLVAF